MNTIKISAGHYEVTDKNGTKWIVEHATIASGYSYNEWHVGTENDPHADQYNTKRECLEAIQYCASHS